MLMRDPVLQELNRRVVAERGMAATPVVEQLNVVEQIGNGHGTGRVARTMYPFILQAVEDVLGQSGGSAPAPVDGGPVPSSAHR